MALAIAFQDWGTAREAGGESQVEFTSRLLVTFGPGTTSKPWGDLAVVDWRNGEIIDSLRFWHEGGVSSHKGLCGASWAGDSLLVVTEVEVLEVDVAPLRLRARRTLPFLNDAHHAMANGKSIWVANSGLDTVEELDREFRPKAVHYLTPRHARGVGYLMELARDDASKSWKRLRGRYPLYTHLTRRPSFRNLKKLLRPRCFRESGEDLRSLDFRPHALHPNHVWVVGGDVWVTLWRRGEIVSLGTGEVLAEGLGRPHDGKAFGDEFFVTDCDRNRLFVYSFDPKRNTLGKRREVVYVTDRREDGFLRGVTADDRHVYLGLTVRRGSPSTQARVRVLERGTWRRVADWVVPPGLGRMVFSVLDASRHYG